MKAKKPSDKVLRKLFCEITQGHSLTSFKGEPLFVKHLKQEDQYLLEKHKEEIYKKAQDRGLPTEKEALDVLIDGDVWSLEEEEEIKSTSEYLDNLQATKKNLIIPSQIESINKDIEEADQKLQTLKAKKQELLTQTCEGYSTKKNNDYSVYLCLYKDEGLSERFLSFEEFSELSKVELSDLFGVYASACADLRLDNIKFLAISHVFAIYYNLIGSKHLYQFFQKPIYNLTFYQLNLLNYARVLNSILENVEGIPENIQKDPEDLLAYAESKRKNKNVVEKSQDKAGFSVMGATTKDMNEMGVADESTVSPFELAKNKGSLTLEDFQNLS